MQNTNHSSYNAYALYSALCAILMTFAWIGIARNISIDTDTGWLLQCLQHFLNGGTYSNDFFETNPPLSFLIYLPVAPYLNQEPYTLKLALLLTFLAYSLIANLCTFFLLKKMETPKHVITLTLTAILFSQTWAMGLFSINKDYLIFVFLIPLSLSQYLITTDKLRAGPLAIFASILGGLAICLKPHFAIIPFAFFLHRLLQKKKICAVIAATDFMTMLLTGIAYYAFITIFFPDYLSVVFPQVTSIYLNTPVIPLINMAYFLIFLLYAILMTGFIKQDTTYKTEITNFINISAILALLCLISFALQGKGFFYQGIPFLGFTAIALFMSTATLVSRYVARKYTSIWITYGILGVLCVPLLTGFSQSPNLTHKKFKEVAFFQKIKDLAPNGTYITYDFKPSYLALPYYFDLKNGARFGIIWPLDGLNIAYETTQDEEKRTIIKEKFTFFVDMLAQDIIKNKPDVICIPRYPDLATNTPAQRLLPFLLKNTAYAEAFSAYSLKESFVFDNSVFTHKNKTDDVSSLTFDLYTISETTPPPISGTDEPQ